MKTSDSNVSHHTHTSGHLFLFVLLLLLSSHTTAHFLSSSTLTLFSCPSFLPATRADTHACLIPSFSDELAKHERDPTERCLRSTIDATSLSRLGSFNPFYFSSILLIRLLLPLRQTSPATTTSIPYYYELDRRQAPPLKTMGSTSSTSPSTWVCGTALVDDGERREPLKHQ